MSETDTLAAARVAAIANQPAADIAPARILARLGNLEARLAKSTAEIAAAQRVRFRVFYEELGAVPTPAQTLPRRDFDAWDEICDHLVLVENAGDDHQRIVGTCRLLIQAVAEVTGLGFCSAGEFELGPLLSRNPQQFLELGRTCILKPWRGRRSLELLWAAIWSYARRRRAGALVGCASFPGTNCLRFAEPLSLLFHDAGAPEQWQARARPQSVVRMDWMAADRLDRGQAIRALPPLIRGYLRLGAKFAREAAIDRQFATVDVLVVLPVERINPRYIGYYGADGERHGASAQAAFEAGDSVSSA
jgi:putative hemolysin